VTVRCAPPGPGTELVGSVATRRAKKAPAWDYDKTRYSSLACGGAQIKPRKCDASHGKKSNRGAGNRPRALGGAAGHRRGSNGKKVEPGSITSGTAWLGLREGAAKQQSSAQGCGGVGGKDGTGGGRLRANHKQAPGEPPPRYRSNTFPPEPSNQKLRRNPSIRTGPARSLHCAV